jgi:hypothetical protein
MTTRKQSSTQANKKANGKKVNKRQIFLCFSENVLEVEEMKTRGKWQIM